MFRSLKVRLLTTAMLAFCLVLGIQVYVRLGFDVPEMANLEAIADRKDVDRVNQAMDQSLQFIRTLAQDYATWDETYDFVKNSGQGFVAQSLIAGLISAQEIDGVRVYGADDEIVFGCDRKADQHRCEETLQVQFSSQLQSWINGFNSQSLSDSSRLPSGIYQSARGPVLFAAAPIVKAGSAQSRAGWLLLWRELSQSQIEKWRAQERVNVSAVWFKSTEVFPAGFDPSQYLVKSPEQLRRNPNGLLHWALPDVFGVPRLFLTIQYDTSFVSQHVWSRSFVVSIFLGCFLIVLTFFVVDRFVVNPLSRLAAEVERIKMVNGYLDVRLSDPGSIEIAKIVRQFNLLLGRVNDQYSLLQEQNQVLEKASYQDQLTGLPNRRALDFFIDEGWTRMLSQNGSMCMALVDCDYFKQYNDRYGHDLGDQVLRQLGKILDAYNGSENTIAARYGGEEFSVVFLNASLEDVELMLDESRVELEELGIPHGDSPYGKVTMSVGLAQITAAPYLHPKNLFRAADQALYTAKHSGRNCLFVSKVEDEKLHLADI